MDQTLATVFDVLHPVTGAAFPSAALADAKRIADVLPPVAKGGFEFSLLAPLTSVDVLQCFDVADGGMTALAAYLSASNMAPGRALTCLTDLAQILSPTADGWRGKTKAVWLEVDADTFDPDRWAPSVFLEFGTEDRLDPDEVVDALGALCIADLPAKRQVLHDILDALEGNAHISHLGAMLSRPDTPLRINIKRLTRSAFEALHRALDLQATSAPIGEIIDKAYRTTLCLDVTDRLLPRIGAEFHFTSLPIREQGWKSLSEGAANRPLAPDAWAAIEGWHAELGPFDMNAVWPDTMILADLLGPSDAYLALEVIPSHIKITVEGARLASAKGYVGYQPKWRRYARPSAPASMSAPRVPHAKAIRKAMDKGLEVLLKSRCQSGLWRDFDFAQRHSDEWVTGYVGTQMATVGTPEARFAAQSAWDELQCRRAPGAGWGYHHSTPPDADSTAWALNLARDLGQCDTDHVTRGYDFLTAHRGERGGFKTYADAELSRLGTSLPDTPAHQAWREEQVEVTASAARAGLDIAIADLVRVQRADGSWPGSWMGANDYATGLATEALSRSSDGNHVQAINRAAQWARGQMVTQTNSFKLAWLIRAVVAGPRVTRDGDDVSAAIQRLLDAQQPDGAWPASCEMLVPTQLRDDQTVQIACYLDCHGTFTTSTVVGTLARLMSEGF